MSKNMQKLRKSLILAVVVTALMVSLAACSSAANTKTTTAPTTTTAAQTTTTAAASSSSGATTTTAAGSATRSFTLAQLATFDGKNGQPAYIAVSGIVYDVSAIREWSNGIHAGRFQAGKDYTKEIQSSPHGTQALDRAAKVGVLAG
jgi:predicted heme/steroid binding protein